VTHNPALAALLALLFGLGTAACGVSDDGDDDAAAGDDDDTSDDDATSGDDDDDDTSDDDDSAPADLHDPWEDLLAEYTRIDGLGHALVNYPELDADTSASTQLEDYRGVLAAYDPADLTSHEERLAFWLNAYNASVLAGVLDGYGGDPAFTVLDGGSFFDGPTYTLCTTALTLNQLEHGVVRGKLDHAAVLAADPDTQDAIASYHQTLWAGTVVDARVHVGLNCASIGCPNLRTAQAPLAYTAETVDAQLDTAARVYVDDAYKGAGPDGISRIFQWFASDFDPEYGGAAGFIEEYRTDGLDGVDTDSWLDYDWTLNIDS
jgi:hypothetical protein